MKSSTANRPMCAEDNCEFFTITGSNLCRYHHELNQQALKKVNQEPDHTARNLSLWILLILGLFVGVAWWVFSK